jgi:hypothetical protein
MIDNKIKKELLKKQKRREYMRNYYRRKKEGKVKPRIPKEPSKFSMKRGEFIVSFQ